MLDVPRIIELSTQRLQDLHLPALAEAQIGQLWRVLSALSVRLGDGGVMSFAEFMRFALLEPGLGYYAAGSQKFGADGDFVTAPELSPWFGRILARQLGDVLTQARLPRLVEFGAGSGRLAAQLLEALAAQQQLPEQYAILEPSPELRQRQQAYLQQTVPALADRVVWLDQWPERAELEALVIANEVFDAMPVERVRWMAGRAQIAQVVVRDGLLALDWTEAGGDIATAISGLSDRFGPWPDGFETEWAPAQAALMTTMLGGLARGAALVIDYGFPQQEFYRGDRAAGTLMCYFRHHKHDDPLFLPGLQDITASVDFSALARAAHGAGARVAGYSTQAGFLLGCGVDAVLAQVPDPGSMAYLQAMQGIKRLMMPGDMGDRFQVLGVEKGIDVDWPGFGFKDLSGRL